MRRTRLQRLCLCLHTGSAGGISGGGGRASEICVLVGEMQLMTLAGEEHNLNNQPLLINSANQNELNGKP